MSGTAPAGPGGEWRGDDQAVFVEAHGRLHFGVLDLRGSLGRYFGGIGAPAPGPPLVLAGTRDDALSVEGDASGRAAEFARRYLRANGIDAGARLELRRALPAHAGLGSGTQLALAVGRCLAELYSLPTDAPSIARAAGRARRSAIGTWTFAGGGFVLEGGRTGDAAEGSAPLLARLPFPASWRCVVAIPEAAPGVSGAAEDAAFTALPPPDQREVERVAHLVLLGVLPSLADGDLPGFGAALSEVQRVTGGWFAPAQGGRFAPGPTAELVTRMQSLGAHGVGQSSWGPAVYGIVEGADAGSALAAAVGAALSGRGKVFEGAFPSSGARVVVVRHGADV